MAASSSGTRFLSPSTLKRFLKIDRARPGQAATGPKRSRASRETRFPQLFHRLCRRFPQWTVNADFDQSTASVAQFLAVAAVCAGAIRLDDARYSRGGIQVLITSRGRALVDLEKRRMNTRRWGLVQTLLELGPHQRSNPRAVDAHSSSTASTTATMAASSGLSARPETIEAHLPS